MMSSINGVVLKLDVVNLAHVLGVPFSGFSDYNTKNWPFIEGINNTTISRTLTEQPLLNA